MPSPIPFLFHSPLHTPTGTPSGTPIPGANLLETLRVNAAVAAVMGHHQHHHQQPIINGYDSTLKDG